MREYNGMHLIYTRHNGAQKIPKLLLKKGKTKAFIKLANHLLLASKLKLVHLLVIIFHIYCNPVV